MRNAILQQEKKISIFTWTFPLLSFAYNKIKNTKCFLWQPEYGDNMFIYFSSILCLWCSPQLEVNESLEGNNEWI